MADYLQSLHSLFDEFVDSDTDFFVSIDGKKEPVTVDTISLFGIQNRTDIEDLIENIYTNSNSVGLSSPWNLPKIKLGDSDSYMSFGLSGSPSINGGVSLPDWGNWPWEWADDVQKIKAWTDLGMNWGGSMTLEIGEKTGTFSLADTTIMPPISINYPPYPGLVVGGEVGLNFNANITIDPAATNKTVKLEFDQDFATKLDLSIANGFNASETKNNRSGSVSVVGSSDPITGLEFDVGLTPKVTARVGIGAPIPGVGDVIVASIDGDYKLPATFHFDPTSATLTFENIIGASATFLKIPVLTPNGWNYSIAEETLSKTTTDLLA
ncbi:hypothetical protein [Prochlorococcus sp. MIT 1306]|uniref:hypothetical protein n=1 Tax=Prochlorococcus sp. MIT 1306 TaxID=1799667 RepID=UPI0007BB1F2C|nr:hypothetical protein [Prochlorococcus sp. MIT 1306]KZR64080.1 hypothetical protein PMIT1306_01050 [Prochlorococcus sp. MIT 1306]